jgi:acetoin utilization deacetylase AcuC-like enzyme
MISVFISDSGYFLPLDFTGAVTEKGIGEGVNANFNYPLPRDTQDDDYCTALRKAIEDIRRFDPAYLLLRFCTSIYSRYNTDRTFY